MNSFFATYFSANFLLTAVSGSSYEAYYLYAGAAIMLAPILYRAYIYIRGNRPEVYRSFDRAWFWGFVSFGLFGLWVYFSRTQFLPIFSTRIVSYFWVLSMVGFTAGLAYYFFKRIPAKLNRYYDKKRKSKYLKR